MLFLIFGQDTCIPYKRILPLRRDNLCNEINRDANTRQGSMGFDYKFKAMMQLYNYKQLIDNLVWCKLHYCNRRSNSWTYDRI